MRFFVITVIVILISFVLIRYFRIVRKSISNNLDSVGEQHYYSQAEIEELTDYIECTFGPVSVIAHEKLSDGFHIDLAVIPPHDNSDFYTICSLGRGAHSLDGVNGFSGRQEFVLYLPGYWNVTGPGFDQVENWWPIAMLKHICRMPEYYGVAELLDFRSPYAECTNASAAFFVHSLSKGNTADVTLSSGKKIDFMQLIPVCNADVEIYDNCNTTEERIARILNVDISFYHNQSDSGHIIIDNILRHFECLIHLK